jgi:hypothetical protein
MERNENDIFDELVRGKLSNYTEAPEPEWIRSIQAKKSRAVNLYQLYRLMLIVLIVGAGIFAGVQLMPYPVEEQTTVSQPQHLEPQSTYRLPVYSTTTKYTTGFAPAGGDHMDNHDGSNTTTFVSEKARTNQPPHTSPRSGKSTVQIQTEPEETVKKLTTPVKKSETSIQPATPVKEAEKQTEADKKDETQASALPCKAVFDYYTEYSGAYNFVHLTALNAQSTLNWNFGDGITGDQKSVSHKFAHSGTYEVILTISDKQNSCSFSKSITYQDPNEKTTPITLNGKVVAGTAVLKNAPLELFRFDEQKGGFKSDQTFRTNQMGEYTIILQRNARYLLKGYPTTDAAHYSATYWGNTSEREDATEIMVMPSENDHLFGYTIQLVYDEQDAEQITDQKPPILPTTQTQQVLLMNSDNQIVSVGTVDANGNYTFGPGVKAGDYKIVNPSNGTSTPTSVTPEGNGLSGNVPSMGAPASPSSASDKVTVYPNPASSLVNLGLNSDQNETATLVITDAAGVEKSRKTVVFNSGFNQAQCDISAFSPGIYYVMIFRNNKQVSSSRLVKLADTIK